MTTHTFTNDGSLDTFARIRNLLDDADFRHVSVNGRPIEGRWSGLRSPLQSWGTDSWSLDVRARTTRGTDTVWVKRGQTVTIDIDIQPNDRVLTW
jgi:hypothetical protein